MLWRRRIRHENDNENTTLRARILYLYNEQNPSVKDNNLYLQRLQMFIVEFILTISQYQTRLANTTFTQQHNLEMIFSSGHFAAFKIRNWLLIRNLSSVLCTSLNLPFRKSWLIKERKKFSEIKFRWWLSARLGLSNFGPRHFKRKRHYYCDTAWTQELCSALPL